MSSPIIQLIVLAAIALFLILRLRDVLGTREGFEKPVVPREPAAESKGARKFEVIEGGPDLDITDHVPADSPAARALAQMKQVDPDFSVTDFLAGARAAYEMILMAFEKGDIEKIRPFVSPEIYDTFAEVIAEREAKGLTIEATFVGVREIKLADATFDADSREAEISVRFVAELISVVRDREGNIVEGSPSEVKQQKDVWTFARVMGSTDPNWLLVATGE